MKIQIYSCGGTIDKVYFDANSDFEIGSPQINAVFDDARVGFQFNVESLMRKDSLDMTDEDRALVRSKILDDQHQHFLVTHGTDTMTKTAQCLTEIEDKTIVFTGSMVPARFRVTDAVFNIGCAVGALQSKPPGVYIAMNGQVFIASKVQKNRAEQRFELIE